MNFKQVQQQLKAISITIKKTEYDEFRVNFLNGKEASAYYTNDLEDALGTGRSMRTWQLNRAGMAKKWGN